METPSRDVAAGYKWFLTSSQRARVMAHPVVVHVCISNMTLVNDHAV